MAAEEPPPSRRLVLHFNLPRTLLVGDPDGKGNSEEKPLTTELALRTALAEQAWGVIENEEFVLSFPDIQRDRPSEDVTSYTEFLHMKYPIAGQSKFSQDENKQTHEQMIMQFADKTGPGAKLKSSFDQMLKCLAFPKPLAKALNINNPILNEHESEDLRFVAPADENDKEAIAALLARFGRYILVPAFWTLIQTLTKAKRDFCVVFHSMSSEMLEQAVLEMNAYSNGEHPCFNGQNKTKKVYFNGDKGTKDMRVQKMDRATIATRAEIMKFQHRPLELPKPGEEFPLMFEPTVLKRSAGIYSGLVHRICTESGCCAVLHDHEYWMSDKKNGGKLYFLDPGDVTDVQQIFFEGCCSGDDHSALRIVDVVSQEVIPHQDVSGVFLHKVEDVRQLVINPLYFVEAVEKCETAFGTWLEKGRKKKPLFSEADLSDPDAIGGNLLLGGLLSGTGTGTLSPEDELALRVLREKGVKDYLYCTVIPVLFGGLEEVVKLRPEDPMEFLAFYLMRHANGYNRTLRLEEK
ncbi:unnamed protein product [Amoebophrya sp. A25]|nr:unnamed protein product [Amoebophrya sp. A25]|eukprot:GSA25T00021210001.1